MTCLLSIFIPKSTYAIRSVSGSIGQFEASNHGLREFVDPAIEYSVLVDIGGNDHFNLQVGFHHWKDKKKFVGQTYTLASYYIPIRFAYNFYPSEEWRPFFGVGAGIHKLNETYERTERHSTISITTFAGTRYMINKKVFVSGEINYLVGTFEGFDHLTFEGITLRTGLGYSFK